MATHSSTLTWRIPGTGEPGGLQSMGLHRVGHDWNDLAAAAAPDICQFQSPSSSQSPFPLFVFMCLFSMSVPLFLLLIWKTEAQKGKGLLQVQLQNGWDEDVRMWTHSSRSGNGCLLLLWRSHPFVRVEGLPVSLPCPPKVWVLSRSCHWNL